MNCKHIDVMLHRHSFVIHMNYVNDEDIIDVLPELASHVPEHTLDINFSNYQISPSGDYPASSTSLSAIGRTGYPNIWKITYRLFCIARGTPPISVGEGWSRDYRFRPRSSKQRPQGICPWVAQRRWPTIQSTGPSASDADGPVILGVIRQLNDARRKKRCRKPSVVEAGCSTKLFV